jgi:hypothetical protein
MCTLYEQRYSPDGVIVTNLCNARYHGSFNLISDYMLNLHYIVTNLYYSGMCHKNLETW